LSGGGGGNRTLPSNYIIRWFLRTLPPNISPKIRCCEKNNGKNPAIAAAFPSDRDNSGKSPVIIRKIAVLKLFDEKQQDFSRYSSISRVPGYD
jgi:hypothetical protein